MRDNFAAFYKRVLDHEGRVFENVAHDRGGPTKCGITIGRLATVKGIKLPKPGSKGYEALCEELRHLPMEDIEAIYRRDYWEAVGADELPAGLDYCVADFGVNSGPSRANKYMQRLVGLKEDGKPSPELFELVANQDISNLINEYCDARERFLLAIIERDASQIKFKKGWLSRVADVRKTSLKMAAAEKVADITPKAMPKAEMPEIGPKDLEGSRKMSVIGRIKAFFASLGLGSAGLTLADGKGYVDGFSSFARDHGLAMVVVACGVGIGGLWLIQRYMVEDANEGRYRPSGGL